MTVYLFSDIFRQFSRFFKNDSPNEQKFLYDIAFGFMPRRFEAGSDEDRIIYDEEQEVEEMYFVSKGIVGIGFSLIATSCTRNHIIAKEIKGAQIIGDHYTVND